ncbi:MAG: fasciclin domain-containing protein [Prevotella sp.]|nr:fasciclin domain-containing protein [Prevotella sp.]
MTSLPLGGLGWAFSSCSDWDDHYESSGESSSLTLWQQMEQRSELSDFRRVLEHTMVFRMHHKTPVSYRQLLENADQSFTVVAPENGSFNADSLISLTQTDQGDSIVEKFFVKNHISRSNSSLLAEMKPVLMLNSKHINITGNSIVRQANIAAANGVLHIIERPLPYNYNIYEALCDMPELNEIGIILRQYEEDWFDADASVSSGIVEGVPVYIDSVVIERNRMLERIGYLASEDSAYWVVVPTNEGWLKVWQQASQYFKYDATVLKADSLEQHYTCRALMEDAVFNLTDQKSTADSLVSVPYLSWRRSWVAGKPVYHVFKSPFASDGILSGAQAMTCSNGMVYKVDEWPFDPTLTFFKPIWAEGESTSLITTYKGCTYNTRREVADSISENAYLQVVPTSTTSNWELTYRLNNTLSGTYDICVVVLPKSVSNSVNPNLNPCKFKATVNYVDENGREQSFNCGNTQFRTAPEHVDTIVVAENFTFPACNYGQQDIKVSLKLTCSILPRETASFAREMYLDCILLRPKSASLNNNE